MSRFVTNQKRNRHELLHKQSRPFVCSICDQAFTKKNLLKAHTTEHTGLAPYQCPVDSCTKRFRYPQELRRHQERRHPCKSYHGATFLVKPGLSHSIE
mmetsp:Transcript_1483/g.4918  ORF Transcript_1483/g.4918 Transcript_1483/m.4918 type:complete len:98 (+) Transcript_1483:2791-3084(+)